MLKGLYWFFLANPLQVSGLCLTNMMPNSRRSPTLDFFLSFMWCALFMFVAAGGFIGLTATLYGLGIAVNGEGLNMLITGGLGYLAICTIILIGQCLHAYAKALGSVPG